MSAQQKLLNWCKSQTNGYNGVNIENFHLSWRDGLAFCALVHSLAPNCGIQFDTLQSTNMLENNALAFESGFKHLGISKLLEPNDMVEGTKPEQFSVMTYLGQYFKKFGTTSRPALQRTNTSPVLMSEEKQKQMASLADVRSRFGVGKEGESEESTSTATGTTKRKPVQRTVSTSQIKSPEQMTASEKLKAQKFGEQFKKPVGADKKPTNDLVKKCYKSGVSLLNVKPVEWNGQLYHPDHFKCTTCALPFSKNILNVGNEPFCEKCYRKALVKNKLKKQDTVNLKESPLANADKKDIRDVFEEQEAERLKAIAEESKIEAAKQEALRDEESKKDSGAEQKSTIPAWRQKLLERKGEATPKSTPTATPTKAFDDKSSQEKAAQEKAAQEKAAQEKAAQEKAAQEKAAQEKAAQEKAAQEKAAADKAAQEKAAADKLAQEKAAAEKLAQEKAAQEKAAQEKLAQEKAAAEKLAQEKAAAEKLAQEKAAAEKAERERIAAEKERERLAQEKIAAEKAAAEKAERERIEAAEKAAAEKAAKEKAERERIAAEKEKERLAQEKIAAEKAAAEREASERAAREKAAAEKAEAERIREQKAAAEKAAAEKLLAEKLQKEEYERIAAAKRQQGEDEKESLRGQVENEKKYSAKLEIEIERLKAELASLRHESELSFDNSVNTISQLQQENARLREQVEKYERLTSSNSAAEKIAADNRAADKLASEKLEAEQAANRRALERVAQEKAAQERLAQEKASQERAYQERVAQERATQERAAQEKAAQEKAAQERASAIKTSNSSLHTAHNRGSDSGERISCWSCGLLNASRYKFCYNCGSPRDTPNAPTNNDAERLAAERAAQEKAAQEKAAQEKAAAEKKAQAAQAAQKTSSQTSLDKQQSYQRPEKVIPEWQRKLLEKKAAQGK